MTGPKAVQVPSFSGYGGATIHLEIDHTEHQRRQADGIGPVTGYGFGGLSHLMALPEGIPVPLASLTKEQRTYVRRVPAAICTIHNGQVTRHAIRPCRVVMATVRAKSASTLALNSASRFTPFCARQVIIRRLTVRYQQREFDFDFYGIGLLLEHDDGTLETLVEPRPWRPKRHTPAGWWFAERAYTAYLEHTNHDARTQIQEA
ncbi:hypothetical protein ACWDSL_06665 [Streptomyces sp. NPDC000941]